MNLINREFPFTRLRRMRSKSGLRDIVSENNLTVKDLIQPVFIKENLFNPHEGLWAETKLNTQFRENTTKWRGVIGVGFVALLVEKVWSMITGG